MQNTTHQKLPNTLLFCQSLNRFICLERGNNKEKEIDCFYTINVHVKDRKLNGTTVPLGEGDADFLGIFRLLQKENYEGNLILQTARSKEGKDTEVLVRYKNLVEDWWEEAKIG